MAYPKGRPMCCVCRRVALVIVRGDRYCAIHAREVWR